jgi:hypothetical protein
MSLTELATRIADIRTRIAKAVSGVALDEFQANAFVFVDERLDAMEKECRSGLLRPAHERYPELSRIAVESDPAVLSPVLGGELIKVEETYRAT